MSKSGGHSPGWLRLSLMFLSLPLSEVTKKFIFLKSGVHSSSSLSKGGAGGTVKAGSLFFS